MALCRQLLLAVDGYASYVRAVQNAFRSSLHSGQIGRPRLIAWREVAIIKVVKRHTGGKLEISHRIVQDCAQMMTSLIQVTQNSGSNNTA